jgi:hypothetical protein
MQEEEIGEIMVLGHLGQKKTFVRTLPSQYLNGKKTGAWGTCLSSQQWWEAENRGSKARPIWAKSKALIFKKTKKKGWGEYIFKIA